MSALELIGALRANYFEFPIFEVRHGVDVSDFGWILVLVKSGRERRRLFGLRFVDYPLAAPVLRFWRCDRWDEQAFQFDFTSVGDAGAGTCSSNTQVPTMCIPFHSDYYRGNWHQDHLWIADQAEAQVADLIGNILRRA